MKDLSLLICGLLACSCLSAADTLQYAQRHYTDENGLPQNSIKFIAPDKSGFVWLATENGVVRFDGQHFRTFNKDNIRLTSSRIYKLMPGRGMDRLYAATEVTQIISLQNGEAKLENGPRQPEGWIDSADSDQHFSFFQALGLPNIYQHVIRVDNYVIPVNGRDFFIINKDKVAYYQQKKLGFQTSFHHTSYWRFFSIDTVLYYLDDAAVYRFSRHDGEKKGTLKGDILLDPAFRRGDKKLELYWNISSRDVFIYLDRSLYLVEKLATGELHTRLLLTGFDLGINRIISAYYDRRYRRIFLGSETRGLYVFTRKEFKAIKSARPNADEVFYAQTAFGNTGVLSSKGEVLGLSETGRILPAIYRLHLIDHYSLLTDTSGFIWIKQRYKLFKFDRNGQHLLDEWTFTPSIRQLYDGSNGNLWIGTSGGLYRMDLLKKSSPPELVTDRVHEISYMQHETDDVLWLASLKGLYRLTISSGKVDTIRGMAGKYIRHVYVPHPNEVWITTAEEGLFLYKDGRLTKFPADQGRYLNAAHCLMEDGQGFYWITTNKGLFRAAKKDLLDYADHKINEVYYHYYDKYAGFNSNEFNGGCQPCGIKLPDGYWSFPSMNGLVLFRPEQQTMELPDKDIFIDRVEVDGKPLSQRDTVVLDKEFDLFKLYVSTPFFGNPQNLHLEYTLYRNTEKQVWNKIGNDGSVSLASLPSGTYLLQVRKLNGFGNNNYSYKNVVLKLPLAYYETWWFKACMVSLGLLGIWAYTRFRLQYIKHKNKMLETRIDERTTTLKTTLSELQASEDILRKQTHIQERLITAITHDIKSPLRYMMLSAKRLTKQSAGQEDPEDAQKNAEMLYEAGYRMYHLTDNLLQYIKLSSRDKQVVMEEVDLAALIGEKVEIFRDIAAAQQTVLLNEVPDRISIRSNSRLLGIVIHNVLDNAVKVTYEGQVSIYIVPDPMLQIIIEDTGIGMRQDMVDWCNTVHTEKEQLNAVPGHSGFGLVIIKELLALVNGELLVSSSQEKGTKVRLLFRER